jgi:hypothetical protein
MHTTQQTASSSNYQSSVVPGLPFIEYMTCIVSGDDGAKSSVKEVSVRAEIAGLFNNPL